MNKINMGVVMSVFSKLKKRGYSERAIRNILKWYGVE